MVFPWDVCYVIQFPWLHRDLFEMSNLYGALSLASTGNDVILRHCTCFRLFHDLRGSLVRKINMYKACMFKLSQLSKSLHGRRKKKLLSKFRTKGSVNTSIASRFHLTVVAALNLRAAPKDKSLPGFSYSRNYRIDLCSQIKTIAYCWLYGIGIRFNPNNHLKCKARCGSD